MQKANSPCSPSNSFPWLPLGEGQQGVCLLDNIDDPVKSLALLTLYRILSRHILRRGASYPPIRESRVCAGALFTIGTIRCRPYEYNTLVLDYTSTHLFFVSSSMPSIPSGTALDLQITKSARARDGSACYLLPNGESGCQSPAIVVIN